MYVLLLPLHWEVTRLLYFIKIVFWDTGDAGGPPTPTPPPGGGGGWGVGGGGGGGGGRAGCSKGKGCWYGEGIQMGRKENLPVWGKYDRLYGVV